MMLAEAVQAVVGGGGIHEDSDYSEKAEGGGKIHIRCLLLACNITNQ